MPSSVKELHQNLRAAFKSQWSEGDTDRLAKQELEQMFSEFGAERSSEAILRFIRSEQFFSVAKMRDYVPAATEPDKHLYSQDCGNCVEGWEIVGWSYFRPNKRNQLIQLYGFEEAQKQEARIHCRMCWKGAK